MPNWCHNELKVSGDKEKVEQFKNDFLKKGFAIIGSYTKDDDGWYDWNINNYGTKWNINPNDLDGYLFECYEDNICIFETEFNTAWTPPAQFIKTASKLYEVAITLSYREYGMWFFGSVTYNNGKLLHVCEFDCFMEADIDCIKNVFGSINNAINVVYELELENADKIIERLLKYKLKEINE